MARDVQRGYKKRDDEGGDGTRDSGRCILGTERQAGADAGERGALVIGGEERRRRVEGAVQIHKKSRGGERRESLGAQCASLRAAPSLFKIRARGKRP